MNIKVGARNYGCYLIIEADNVRIEEDIETREYPKDENGKTVFDRGCKRDVDTDALDQIASVLSDMIYYRKSAYDSSELIAQLFDKLPAEVGARLYEGLEGKYRSYADNNN